MGAFEDFVNGELPLRISTAEDGGGTGNFPAGKALVTTGVGLQVATQDFPEGGGSPFINTEEILFADLKQKISNNELEIGKYYDVQDTQTKNRAGFNINYTAPIEKLIVQAISSGSVSLQAFSKDFPSDLIYFDIYDTGITDSVDGGFEDGEDWGGSVITQNYTTSSFDMNIMPIIDDDFYVYNEHDDGEGEWEGGDIDDTFTITDLGNGWYRFTDLTGDANFDHPDFCYCEFEFLAVILERNGNIIYRKDVNKNIEASFDFRNVKYNRTNLDVMSITEWDSGTTYNQRALVRVGNKVYTALYSNTNQSVTGKYWVNVFAYGDRSWFFTAPYFNHNGSSYPLSGVLRLVPVFAEWDGTSFIYNDDNVKNVSLFGDNNVVMKESGVNKYFRNIIISEHADNNTFAGSCEDMNLQPYSKTNIFDWASNVRRLHVSVSFSNNIVANSISNVIVGTINASNIQSVSDCNIANIRSSMLGSVSKTTIGYNNWYMFLNMQNGKIGNNNNNFFLYSSYYDTFGNSNNHIESMTNNFSNNKFGDLNRYFRFAGIVRGVEFGVNNGRTGTWLIFNGSVLGFKIKDDNFYLGQSTFSSTVQNVRIGNSIGRIRVGYFINCTIGTNVSNLEFSSLRNTEIKDNARNLLFSAVNVENCIFYLGVRDHTSTTAPTFRNNIIQTSYVNYGGSATHVNNSYYCTVFQRPDGQKRLSFVGNSDTLEVYNVDA